MKVNAQLPVPLVSIPVQLCPELAVTVTVPVGTPLPVTLKATVTDWPIADGLGKLDVIVVVLTA